jgi:hypothetical protein
MTFEEHASELSRLKALAKSLGMSAGTFKRIALEVTEDAHRSSVKRTPEQTLDEIRRRIQPPRTKRT